MRKAGDLLSAIIDEKTIGKAKEYSRLFAAWEQLTEKFGIAAAAYHTRILDFRRGIVMTEADHPGWIQLLQTKEHLLLYDLQKLFPSLGITGLSFSLGKTSPDSPAASEEQAAAQPAHPAQPIPELPADEPPDCRTGYEKIKDGSFKDALQSLEKAIKENHRA
ncbi:MAG: DUF721 domain-containing protein [Treponema sp.]|nr:DUF721 domain-containing protein [Treponema sp.]